MTSEGYSTEDILDGEYGKLSPGAPMDGGDIEFDFFNVIFFSPGAPMDGKDFELDFF